MSQNNPKIKDIKDKKTSESSGLPQDYLNRKSRRLASALYMVTNLLPENEPLKRRLREESLALLTDIGMSLNFYNSEQDNRSADVFYDSNRTRSAQGRIWSIMSLMDIGRAAGLLSPMNAEILQQEYKKLAQSFESVSPQWSKDFLLSNDNPVPATLPSIPGAGQQTPSPIQKTGSQPKTATQVEPLGDSSTKADRREQILKTLKGQGWLAVKDIAMVVSGCSQKTIQRELNDLLDKKQIKKKGDKRWARYAISTT
ncbi:MAG: hypothetical protein ACOCU8_03525 [Patescibacteria group bacterium]